jgi:hypothetical protein
MKGIMTAVVFVVSALFFLVVSGMIICSNPATLSKVMLITGYVSGIIAIAALIFMLNEFRRAVRTFDNSLKPLLEGKLSSRVQAGGRLNNSASGINKIIWNLHDYFRRYRYQ